ncbi:unnamed protein product, partial [Notodromas monacha]
CKIMNKPESWVGVLLVFMLALFPKPSSQLLVSQEELLQLCEDLVAADVNSLGPSVVAFDLQENASNQTDLASGPLYLEAVPASFLALPTIAALVKLFDNYDHYVGAPENSTAEELQEVEDFLDVMLSTQVFNVLTNFLLQKGTIEP